jgi:serine/threonine protein kinase/tetratricopeptide (TPR) repeat protein
MSASVQREQAIFVAAVGQVPPDQWEAYARAACAGDELLLARVQQLLRAHAEAGSFLDVPAPDLATTVAQPPACEGPGTLVGPYKLLEQIGEGGFGVVFMAEQQQPLRRKVALKVLKPGMDTKQVVARFEAERQALALMDHPNIARVLDAGTTGGGRPYFVMELVKGIAITEYCDQAQLGIRERLGLFVDVCQGVQHAHQKGVIHRDLKPSNVLVTLHDGTPVVKVIDFGVAKATGPQLTDRTLFTGFAQLVGTPLYMSPEQAALSGLDVDTRSDVYALGVLLYEMLTGTTPFEKERLREADYDELRRIIREEEPPRPSTRVGTLGQAATTLAAQRRTDPKRLCQLFRGELDWVVMKAMEKDRNRRYESASAFAADVRRYLGDEPVLACPPSAGYRCRKFVRRYRARLAAAGLLAAALVAAVTGLAVSNVLISREKEDKDRALRQATANAEEAERQRRLAQANLQLARKAVDEVYEQLVGELDGTGRYDQHLAQKFQEKTLAFYEEFARLQETDPRLRLGVARAQVRVAEIHLTFRHNARAEEELTRAIARLDELQGELPGDPARRRELAKAHLHLGHVLKQTHRAAAAVPVLRRGVALFAPPADPVAGPADRYLLALLYLELGLALPADPAAAEEAVRAGAAVLDQLVAESPDNFGYRSQQMTARLYLGQVQAADHRPGEAEASYRQALGLLDRPAAGWDRRGDFAAVHLRLGEVLEATNRPDEAERSYRESAELMEQVLRGAPLSSSCWDTLFAASGQRARLLEQAGRSGEAADCRRRALDSLDRFVDNLPTEDSYEDLALNVFGSFAGSLKLPGERPEHEPLYRGTLAVAERLAAKFPKRPGPRALSALWHATLGSVLTARGRPAEAEAAYRQARADYEVASDLEPNRPRTLNNLAWLLATCPDERLRAPPRAVELATRATELAPQYGYLWNTRGVAHYQAGDWDAARAALEKSMALYTNRPEGTTQESFNTFFLAMTSARLGDGVAARRWYDRAVRWMERYQPDDLELRRIRAEADGLVKKAED